MEKISDSNVAEGNQQLASTTAVGLVAIDHASDEALDSVPQCRLVRSEPHKPTALLPKRAGEFRRLDRISCLDPDGNPLLGCASEDAMERLFHVFCITSPSRRGLYQKVHCAKSA